MKAIRFYRQGDAYGTFSNFSAHPIHVDGVTWPTTEHYFQAQKFLDPELQAMIRALPTAGDAAKTGRRRDLPLRADWEAVKEDVMRTALHAKFTQHEDARTLLLSTGDASLIEHTRNDTYWADGGDGHGLNRLGLLLMDLRAALRHA
ncbi:NADAR family protein [Deinococcus maricopensis]|uniref:NADAR domain-containing protein n=1 Tax=Deinococcus maricopensis (strain DSM 21211 / LMG 22137 / NRRL B-23946 / LB-34) TaxID=709986 RepID=E8U8N6_DEIML|nr:NADAR family protein [Deinococcus maricopensis]ADV67425.1 Conserved hypothetical protein CHP02464 [Deinococcus maricopensis DSM 21211]